MPNQLIPEMIATALKARLPTWPKINWLDSVDSTNAQLLSSARVLTQSSDWPRLLGSQHQTQGRGRAGRPWLNKPGQTLMFSCGFFLKMPARHLTGLAPALGIAACSALRTLAGERGRSLSMKWPNDIMIEDAKLAGILVESRIKGDQLLIVAGIGLNLQDGASLQSELNREISDWTRLQLPSIDPIDMAACIAQSWSNCLHHYNDASLDDLINQFKAFDYLQGKTVNVIQDGKTLLTGVACGMTKDASLLVQTSDSVLHPITVGDISVRAIEG